MPDYPINLTVQVSYIPYFANTMERHFVRETFYDIPTEEEFNQHMFFQLESSISTLAYIDVGLTLRVYNSGNKETIYPNQMSGVLVCCQRDLSFYVPCLHDIYSSFQFRIALMQLEQESKDKIKNIRRTVNRFFSGCSKKART